MRILAVTNVYPSPNRPYSGTFVEQQITSLRQYGLDVDVLLVERHARGPTSYLRTASMLRKNLHEVAYDLVHVMYGGIMALLITRELAGSKPVVVSFCGSDLLGEPLAGISRRTVAYIGVLCSHAAARRADGIIVKSDNLLAALPSDIGRREKIAVIPNGVDLDRFRPIDRHACLARLGWSSDESHIVFPANSGDPVKRSHLARSAVGLLRSSGRPAVLHPLQGVPHREVVIWLNAADALLLTSDHEGSPNIVKEAMACNLPVVSVDVGDVRQRISSTDGCYICDDSAESLAEALSKVVNRDSRTDGRRRMEDLSLGRVAERVSKFYEATISRTVPENSMAPTTNAKQQQEF